MTNISAANHSHLHVVLLGDSNTFIGGDDCDKDRGWSKWFKERFSLLPVKVMPGVALLGLIVLKQKSIPRNILRSWRITMSFSIKYWDWFKQQQKARSLNQIWSWLWLEQMMLGSNHPDRNYFPKLHSRFFCDFQYRIKETNPSGDLPCWICQIQLRKDKGSFPWRTDCIDNTDADR